MRVIIFIGHFKTGSTSLQRFLCRNFVSLVKAGILYPSVEAEGVARNMAALRNGRDFRDMDGSLNVTEPHNALALRLKNEEDGHGIPAYHPNLPAGFHLLQMIDHQIAALDPHTMILCSEVFALFGLTKQRRGIERLARRFAHHDVTIYANIRRPDEYLSSWHRQRLKFGEKMEPLRGRALKAYLPTAHVQHARMVQGWMEAFPEAKLILRDFEDVKAAGGTVADFQTNARIAFPSKLAGAGDFNISVPSAVAEIARLAMHDLTREQADAVTNWLIVTKDRVTYPPDRDVEMFGPQNREILVREYAPVLDKLNALASTTSFFGGGERTFGETNAISDVEAASSLLPALIRRAGKTDLGFDLKAWLASLTIGGR